MISKNKSEKSICKTGQNVKNYLFNLMFSENGTSHQSDIVNFEDFMLRLKSDLLEHEKEDENNLSKKEKFSETETSPEESDFDDFMLKLKFDLLKIRESNEKSDILLISDEELVDWDFFLIQIRNEFLTTPDGKTDSVITNPNESMMKHPSNNGKVFIICFPNLFVN